MATPDAADPDLTDDDGDLPADPRTPEWGTLALLTLAGVAAVGTGLLAIVLVLS